MVKFPSLNTIISDAFATIKRFPMAMLCSVIATTLLIYLTHHRWPDKEETSLYPLVKIIMCCSLGFSLFLVVALYSELRKHTRTQLIFLQALALSLIILYYFIIGNLKDFDNVRAARYLLFLITVHLLVAFAPFIDKRQVNGFWQYNKTLFLRFLLSALYTVVLYGGIALALWSVDILLHFNINYKKYFYAWYILGCLFSTWFFLAGIPRHIEELDKDISYIKGLKVFTQYVLLPLVTLYLLILYAYICKIIIQWRLPKGLVSYLVIGYSVVGILSLLLVFPVRNNDENTWIKIFSRWFYLALYPLIILLGVAIFHRVSQYGITEDRYFILVLALWLLCIASYFLFSKSQNIKIIPTSLAFLAFFTSFGPWGAFSISEHSQMNHLEKLLVKNKILVNDKIDRSIKHHITTLEREDIISVIEYLDKSNSLNMMQPWFTALKIDTIKGYYKSEVLTKNMNIVYSDGNELQHIGYFRDDNNTSVNVKGFDYYSYFNGSDYNDNFSDNYVNFRNNDTVAFGYFNIGDSTFSIYPPLPNSDEFLLKKDNKILTGINFNAYVKQLASFSNSKRETDNYTNNYIPREKFMLDVETNNKLIRFVFKHIQVEERCDSIHISLIDGVVLEKDK